MAKDKDEKDEKDEKPAYRTDAPEVTPLAMTVAESSIELRDFVDRTMKRMARGSKSDIDKIVPVLALILAWIDLLLANVPDPPPARDPLDTF